MSGVHVDHKGCSKGSYSEYDSHKGYNRGAIKDSTMGAIFLRVTTRGKLSCSWVAVHKFNNQ